MPHLTVEHSSDIPKESIITLQQDIQKLMSACEGNFAIEGCKTRSISFDNYFVGKLSQEDSSFIHIDLRILSGRSSEIRNALSVKILQFLNKFISVLKLNSKRSDTSVNIVEMDIDTYQKNRIGE